MDFLDVFGTEPMRHAIVVHFPIVLAILGAPLVYIIAVVDTERNTLRWLGVACYALLAVSALVSSWTGERAYDHVPPTAPAEISDLAVEHGDMAEKVYLFAAGTGLLILASFVKHKGARKVALFAAMAASLWTAGWVSMTGHRGGQLVYEHALGTPAFTRGGGNSSGSTTSHGGSSGEEQPPMAIRDIDMSAAKQVSFVRDVLPIVETHCLECHDSEKAKGDYVMSSVSTMLEEGKKSGPGVIPGKPDDSSVVKYIRGVLRPRMPKGKDKAPLADDDLHTIRMWIAAGAVDDSASAAPAAAPAPTPSPVEQPVPQPEPASSSEVPSENV